jgi:threonine aldolase
MLSLRRQVLLGDECHIYHYERGGISALGGCVMHTVRCVACTFLLLLRHLSAH